MARIPKNNINTSFFHIMVQGINRESIFDDNKDKEKYLEILKNTQKEISIQILSYCVMGNHTHLLVFEENADKLTKFMHNANLKYAMYYNKKHSRVGYVFRDRYKAQPIFSEKHLITCVKYIHNNPVKAGICIKPEEYRYSSCNYNIFKKNNKLHNEIEKIIEQMKQKNQYEEIYFIEDEIDKDQICKEIVKDALEKNNLKIDELNSNEEVLKTIVYRLKQENKISLRKIEEVLKINRKRLSKL